MNAPERRHLPTARLVAPLLLVAVVVSSLPAPDLHAADPRDQADWWLEHYGAVEEAGWPLAARAREVFARLRAVTEADARLFFLDQSSLQAFALPSGAVVVSRGAVELCYDGWKAGSKKAGRQGDARMAFVLGHELGHLARRDFLKARAFAAVVRHGGSEASTEGVEKVLAPDPEDDLERELGADLLGLELLWWAGFDPGEIVDREARFLARWYAETAAAAGAHPSPAQRGENLAAMSAGIAESLPYFDFGVRLLQLGRHRDALRLLEEFKIPFASREVLNNLGLVHLELAAEALAACDGSLVVRFLLPSVIDPETLADRSRRRGDGASPCFENRLYREHMDPAIAVLERAAAMDEGYLPARLNLAAADLLDRRGAEAHQAAKAALELAPRDPRAINAEALGIYLLGEENGIDTFDRALERLAAAADEHPEAAYLLYNQAALNDERRRTGAAKEAWAAFLAAAPTGPHAERARERLGGEAPPPPAPPPVVNLPCPLPLGDAGAAKRSAAGGAMKRERFSAGTLRGVFWDGGRVKALQIGSAVEVVEERLEEPAPLSEYRLRHGPPLHTLDLADGVRFLRYADFALDVRDGRVRAVVYFEPAAGE